jgi:hypothetical protein
MDETGLILLEDETSVAVWFRLSRDGQSGRVKAKQVRDFDVLMSLYREEDTVLLQNSRGTWKAQVHLLELHSVDDLRLAFFRFTVQGKVKGA